MTMTPRMVLAMPRWAGGCLAVLLHVDAAKAGVDVCASDRCYSDDRRTCGESADQMEKISGLIQSAVESVKNA